MGSCAHLLDEQSQVKLIDVLRNLGGGYPILLTDLFHVSSCVGMPTIDVNIYMPGTV